MSEGLANTQAGASDLSTGPGPLSNRPATRPLAWHLGVLCTAFALPVTLFVGWLLWQSASAERARLEREGMGIAGAIAAEITRDLGVLTAALRALAASSRLPEGDYAGFHRTASEVARSLGIPIVLLDPGGQQVVNTRLASGDALPRVPAAGLDTIREVLATRSVHVSDLFVGATARAPI